MDEGRKEQDAATCSLLEPAHKPNPGALEMPCSREHHGWFIRARGPDYRQRMDAYDVRKTVFTSTRLCGRRCWR